MANEMIRLISPVLRMSFPNVVEPKAFKKGNVTGQPNYNTSLFGEPDLLRKFKRVNEKGDALVDCFLVDVAMEMVKKTWASDTDTPEKLNVFIQALNMNKMWPFADGTKAADDPKAQGKSEFLRGQKIIRCGSTEKIPPALHVREKKDGKVVTTLLNRGVPSDMARAKALFVGGNYAYAELSCTAGDTPQKHVKFYLNSLVFVKQGERLGQAQSLIGKFDGIEGGIDDQHDPTAGMSDDIPF